MSKFLSVWTQVLISEVLDLNENGKPFQQGWSPQCHSHPAPEGSWGALKTTAIQHGEFWPHENKALPDHLEPRPHIEVKPGDLLMTCAGPRNRCGVACLVERTSPRLMMSGKMYRFRPNQEVMHAKYLMYFLLTHATAQEIDRMKTGISDSGLNLTHDRFATLRVPVAPPNEQRRIVAKIEELFSELDKGVEALTTAREQLKVYRNSLLKCAFESKLTEDWRARNPGKVQTPSERLACIRSEAKTRFAKAIREWQANGKKGIKPQQYEIEDNPDMPSDLAECCVPHWAWLKLGDVANVSGGLTKNPSRSLLPMKMKYLRVANVYADRLELDDVSEIGVTSEEFENLGLQRGDMLVVEGNGSKDQIGRVAVWNGTIPDVGHQNHLIRVRFVPGMEPRYFLSFLMSPLGRDLIVRQASSTSGLHTLSISKVAALPIPVPTIDEQEAIIAALDERLSEQDRLSDEIEAGLARSTALRQSILKQAFSGQLVSQDPTDEPASVLLERIRAEHKKADAKKPGRKTKITGNSKTGKRATT